MTAVLVARRASLEVVVVPFASYTVTLTLTTTTVAGVMLRAFAMAVRMRRERLDALMDVALLLLLVSATLCCSAIVPESGCG